MMPRRRRLLGIHGGWTAADSFFWRNVMGLWDQAINEAAEELLKRGYQRVVSAGVEYLARPVEGEWVARHNYLAELQRLLEQEGKDG